MGILMAIGRGVWLPLCRGFDDFGGCLGGLFFSSLCYGRSTFEVVLGWKFRISMSIHFHLQASPRVR